MIREQHLDYSLKDSIFFYSKSDTYTFNIQYTPYTDEYVAGEWTQAPSGRYYKFENMLDPQNKMQAYDFHGTTARWRTTPDKFEELWNAPQTEVPNSHGRIRLGKDGKPIKRCRIVFMDELPGVPINDNWFWYRRRNRANAKIQEAGLYVFF